jgi:hypothetical protein
MSKGLGKIQQQALGCLAEAASLGYRERDWFRGHGIPESHRYGHTPEALARCAECQKHNISSWGHSTWSIAAEMFWHEGWPTPSESSTVRRALRGLVARGLAETKRCGYGRATWNEYRITEAGLKLAG